MNEHLKDTFERIHEKALLAEAVANRFSEELSNLTTYISWDGCLNINAIGLERLQWTRHALRECLGEWKDKLEGVYPHNAKQIRVVYTSSYGGVPIEIRAYFDREDLPRGVIKDGCTFKRVETSYEVLVCETT